MKLYPNPDTMKRCEAAALRNCLTYVAAPLDCPVRKCRRDGVCSGPILCESGDRRWIARNDAADIAPGDGFVPVCYRHIPDDLKENVDGVYQSHCREFSRRYSASTFETTRAIASRRWRKLQWREA